MGFKKFGASNFSILPAVVMDKTSYLAVKPGKHSHDPGWYLTPARSHTPRPEHANSTCFIDAKVDAQYSAVMVTCNRKPDLEERRYVARKMLNLLLGHRSENNTT